MKRGAIVPASSNMIRRASCGKVVAPCGGRNLRARGAYGMGVLAMIADPNAPAATRAPAIWLRPGLCAAGLCNEKPGLVKQGGRPNLRRSFCCQAEL